MYGEHGGIEVILSTHRWQQPTVSEPPMVNCTFPGPPRIHVIPSARIRAPRPTGVGREPGRCIRVPILNPQCPGNCEKGGRHRWLKSRDLGNSSQLKKKKHKGQRGGSERGWERSCFNPRGQALLFATPSGSWKVWSSWRAGFGSCLSLFSEVVTLFESNGVWKKTRGRREGWVVT